MKRWLLLCFVLIAETVVAAPSGEYLINLPTAKIQPEGVLQFRIAHRFAGEVDEQPGRTFLGLDAGAKMRFSFDYALRDHWLISAGRTSWTGATELYTKYRFHPNFAIQAGATFELGADQYKDDTGDSVNVQLIYQQPVTDTLQLLLVPSYASATKAKSEQEESTTAIGMGAHYSLNPQYSLSVELIKPVAGYEGDNRNPVVSYAADWYTGGHLFQLLLSNSTLMNTNRYITTQGIKDSRKFHFGFSITRLF